VQENANEDHGGHTTQYQKLQVNQKAFKESYQAHWCHSSDVLAGYSRYCATATTRKRLNVYYNIKIVIQYKPVGMHEGRSLF
jgi:hypothetical protein